MIHSRRLRAAPTLATLGWVLTTGGPVAAKTITYSPQQVYYTYCFSHPPAARISRGDDCGRWEWEGNVQQPRAGDVLFDDFDALRQSAVGWVNAVEVKAGANSFTLDMSNATPMN